MFCSGCGQAIDPSQQYCLNCGRAVPHMAPALAPTPWFYTRVHRHIQSLSVLWIAYGVWTLFGWILAMSFFAGAFQRLFRTLESRPLRRIPLQPPPVVCSAYYRDRYRTQHPRLCHWLCPGKARALGPYPRPGRGLPYHHQAHHRDCARHLHTVGAVAVALRTGVRPDSSALRKLTVSSC